MPLVTLNGFVLIDEIEQQSEISDGGIFVGEIDKELAPVTGKVVAVPVTTETGVAVDDMVMFKFKAAQPIKVDGKTFYLIGEKSLIGIVCKPD